MRVESACMGLVLLSKRPQRAPPPTLLCEDPERRHLLGTRKRSLTGPRRQPHLGLAAPRTVRNTFPLFISYPVCALFPQGYSELIDI